MPLGDHDAMSPAEIEEAIRRAEVQWRAWELGLRSDEVAALLAQGLEHAEEHLRAIGFTR